MHVTHSVLQKKESLRPKEFLPEEVEDESSALKLGAVQERDRHNSHHHSSSRVELVVNIWKEDLSYIVSMFENRSIPASTMTVYCNGPHLKDRRCVRVPNYGAEGWAYLNHIVEKYDHLAEITVFTQASINLTEFGWLKCRKLNYLLSKLDTRDKQSAFPGFASLPCFGKCGTRKAWAWEEEFDIQSWRAHAGAEVVPICRPSVFPLGSFYKRFLGEDLSWPKSTGWLSKGSFAVRREMIHKHPKTLYQSLRAEFERCGEDVSLTVDHYMERLWKPIFDRDGVDDTSGENACPLCSGCPVKLGE
jgi:hypothetical protein